ncbi:hypothetical protein HBA55_34520 [Pseudomaricurvus alkylphenolicus]|uniref:hypothetical protein n=1 Tax=Pseudomaricurvus alkylphenolicus TaxID=1306991 RepID=UPI00141DBA92|nr:hypothetical protein [Pseudomaricurvus alkylphenolicus]NIB44746.1 hypothetical protein [Pseudomaricurvus alkylphenolicus]
MAGATDFMSGIMDAYFTFENQQLGLELQRAEIQQQRTHDALSVEQQVSATRAQQQGTAPANSNMATYAVLGVAAVAVVLLMRK